MTNKKASRQAKDMKERLSFLETVIGYNAESERNGNGIISLLDNLFEKMKASENRIDRLDNRSSYRYNELNNKIEKIEQTLNILEKQLYSINEQYVILNNSLKSITDKISKYEESLKSHSDLLSDAVTGNKLMKVVKGAGILSGFLLALGTIFGTIAFIYNKLMN